MPLAKHRPNFSELIVVAAKQKQKKEDQQTNILQLVLNDIKLNPRTSFSHPRSNVRRVISRASTITPMGDKDEPQQDEIHLSSLLFWSTTISSLLKSSPGRLSRILAVGLAACSLAIESSPQDHFQVFQFIDRIVDIYFIVFGLLKILAWYANAQIKKLVQGKVESWDLFKHSGVFDAVFSSLSFYFGHSYAGQWCRLVRLLAISTLSLQQLPHIDVLVVSFSPSPSLTFPHSRVASPLV
jgi:hypothetical protein